MAKQEQKKSVKKVLRIGIFQNKNCLEERLMHSHKPISIGQDFKKNDFVVPASNLPKTFTIFETAKDGTYILHFTDKMKGRVSVGDAKPMKLAALVQAGKAKKTATGYSVPVDRKTFGRVAFDSGGDEVAVLFQFVKPPPPRARPVLPASMRGGLVYGVLGATTLAITTAVSAVLQIGFVAFLLSRDWPIPRDLDYKMPDRFVTMLEEEKEDLPEPEPVETDPDGEGEAVEDDSGEPSEPDEPAEEAKSDEPKNAEERAAADAERKRRLAEQVQNKTILGQIGSISTDGSGSLIDALSEGAGKTTMDEAFANSTGVRTNVAGAEKSGLRTSGSSGADGKGSAVGIGSLKGTSGAAKAGKGVGTGKKAEKKIKVRVNMKTPEKVVGGVLDGNSISKVIKRRQSQIQRCYEREIKKNPKAAGKVIINFTIGTAGRVTKSKATTDSVGGGVGKCVAKQIQRMKFARPKGGAAHVKKTFVFEAAK